MSSYLRRLIDYQKISHFPAAPGCARPPRPRLQDRLRRPRPDSGDAEALSQPRDLAALDHTPRRGQACLARFSPPAPAATPLRQGRAKGAKRARKGREIPAPAAPSRRIK
jgi:hypothetical protein